MSSEHFESVLELEIEDGETLLVPDEFVEFEHEVLGDFVQMEVNVCLEQVVHNEDVLDLHEEGQVGRPDLV